MEVKIFTLPINPTTEQEEEINKFIRSHKVVDVRKEVVTSGGNAFWTFCVTYVSGAASSPTIQQKPKIDYREVLSEDEFAAYVRLRDIRKEISDEKGLPPFAVFTNEELSNIAKMVISENVTVSSLTKVQGIGQKKAEKYGPALIDMFYKTIPPSIAPEAETKEEIIDNETQGLPF